MSSCPALRRSALPDGEGGIRAGAIVGTCEEMCPAPERERRSRLADIQVGASLVVDLGGRFMVGVGFSSIKLCCGLAVLH